MTQTLHYVGEAARHRMLIRAECARCGKTADFWASAVAAIYGYGREISSLPFRCQDCGERATSIRAAEYISDERRKQYVWHPMRVK